MSNYPTLENCLFGAVSLSKNVDIHKYNYSGMVMNLIEKELFHLVMDLLKM